MVNRIISTIVLALVFFTLPAQEENGAFGGGNGIFVFLHDGLYSAGQPDAGLVSIQIQRKASGESSWEDVAQVSSPETEKAFTNRLKKVLDALPYDIPVLRDKVSAVWESVQNWNRDPEAGGYLVYLPVQIASGLAYYDRTAERNVTYTYRIIKRAADGASLDEMEFSPVSWPKELAGMSFEYKDHISDGLGMSLEFTGAEDQFPSVVQLYRKDELDGSYEKVEAKYSIQSMDGLNKVTVLDPSAEENKLYQYQLRPLDQFGNSGAALESPVIGHYNFKLHAPVIIKLKTDPSPNGIGTLLQWQYENYDLLSSVRVLRSDNADGPYEMITELPRNATSYIDQTIAPMTGFYYQLQVVGPAGETGAPGTPVFAYFEDQRNSVAPFIRSSTVMSDGIELEIEVKDTHVRGVRVYRATSADASMTLVSDLLPAKDGLIKWTDEHTGEDAAGYYYAAKAISTSHIASPPSDREFVSWPGRNLNDALLSPPGNLVAKLNGNSISLLWDAPAIDVPMVRYAVLRKETGEQKYTNLTPDMLEFNNFTDRTVESGKSYQYAVGAVHVGGQASELSAPVQVTLKIALPLSPSGIKALQTSDGVQLQWNAVEDEKVTASRIYRYTRGGKPSVIAEVNVDADQTYLDRNVQQGQLYFYFVRSVSEDDTLGKASQETGIRVK